MEDMGLISNAQRYKMLGNGWTVAVIKHIFKHLPEGFLEKEDLKVVSLFDGMSCGQQAIKELLPCINEKTENDRVSHEDCTISVSGKEASGISECGSQSLKTTEGENATS